MKNKYLMLTILCLTVFTITVSYFKITPIISEINKILNISVSQTSWLMSVFTLAGIVLSLPSTVIMNKVGCKRLLLSLIIALFTGNLIGLFTNNYILFFISRIIEGISFAMYIIAGLMMINAWFEGGGIGAAIGLFNASGPIGVFVVMNIGIPIERSYGVKGIWFILVVLSAILFILILLFVKLPQSYKSMGIESSVSFIEAVKNGQVWLMALMRGCIAFSLVTYLTTYPQLFRFYYNINPVKANFYASLNGLFGIIACVACGIIVDKIGKPVLICLLSFIGLTFTGYIVDLLTPSTYVLHTFLSAVFSGFAVTSILIIIPVIIEKPELVGYTISFNNLLYYIGSFFCTPIILGIVDISGWNTAKYALVLVGLTGVILTIILKAMLRL